MWFSLPTGSIQLKYGLFCQRTRLVLRIIEISAEQVNCNHFFNIKVFCYGRTLLLHQSQVALSPIHTFWVKRACGRVTERKIKFFYVAFFTCFYRAKNRKSCCFSQQNIEECYLFIFSLFCLFIRLILLFCLFPIREIHRHLQQLREYRPDFNLRNIFVSQDVDLLRVIRTTLRKSLSLHCNFVSKQIVTIQTGGNSFWWSQWRGCRLFTRKTVNNNLVSSFLN